MDNKMIFLTKEISDDVLSNGWCKDNSVNYYWIDYREAAFIILNGFGKCIGKFRFKESPSESLSLKIFKKLKP